VNPEYLSKQIITQNILVTIGSIREYKGKQNLFKEQSPQILETLRKTAIIQSTESSNRIEGVTAPLERIKQIVEDKTTPTNRSEQEIAGYRKILDMIHTHYNDMNFTSGLVLQLHRDMYQFTNEQGGKWKNVDNEITEMHPDGKKIVRFKPVPAYNTPAAMEQLHSVLKSQWELPEVEKLLLIPSYVLDFLCIHPFRDGNGRIARLISLLLLYQAGFEVGRYISLEKIIESTKESYYDTLYKSSQGWHEGTHDIRPWWEYFLGILLNAYREFEGRVGILTTAKGAKRQMIFDAVERMHQNFKYSDIALFCPGVSRPTINRALAELRKNGKIKVIKGGRDATWRKM
jgi:Fic family protein